MEINRASAESFLISSIVSTGASENREVIPTEFSYNKSTPMMAVEHSLTTAPASTPVLGQQVVINVPRIGFSHNSFLRVKLTITAAAGVGNNATIADVFSSALFSKEQGLLRLFRTLRIKTRKQVLFQHDRHSAWVALETLEDEQLRDILRLCMCQGVKANGTGASSAQVITQGSSEDIYWYIPLGLLFPMFGGNVAHSLDLAFVEPLLLEFTTEAGSAVFGADRFISGTVLGTASMTSCDLVSSHIMYDSDAYNKILKKYQSTSKIQVIGQDYYLNNNVIAITGGAGEGQAKLEGVKNATSLYVVAYDANGRVLDTTTRIRLTSGNKDIVNYTRFEAQALAFNSFKKGKSYKDNLVVELGFSMNSPLLDLESYGGALSVGNLIDPRVHLTASGAVAQAVIVAKQLHTYVISTANGSVELGASN